MKYTIVGQAEKNGIQLIGVGRVLGRPAKEIKSGDFLLWNYGSKCQVYIEKETEKTIVFSTVIEGRKYIRRLNKDRLVCILE